VEEEEGLHDRVLGCMIPSCEGICKLFTHVHGEQLQSYYEVSNHGEVIDVSICSVSVSEAQVRDRVFDPSNYLN
jgi:hypothetical protein